MTNSESSEVSNRIPMDRMELLKKHSINIDGIDDIDNIIESLEPAKETKYIDDYNVKEIIKKLESYLCKDNLTSNTHHQDFLKNYCRVLDYDNITTINKVTSKIILSIEQMLVALGDGETRPDAPEAAALAAWLSALALRPAPRAARALRLLLRRAACARLERCVARAWWAAGAGADALLALADAVRAPPAPPGLAQLLLLAAGQRLALPDLEPTWDLGELSADQLRDHADQVRDRPERALLLRVAARVLASEPSGPSRQRLIDKLSEFQHSDHAMHLEVTKLEVLFGGEI